MRNTARSRFLWAVSSEREWPRDGSVYRSACSMRPVAHPKNVLRCINRICIRTRTLSGASEHSWFECSWSSTPFFSLALWFRSRCLVQSFVPRNANRFHSWKLIRLFNDNIFHAPVVFFGIDVEHPICINECVRSAATVCSSGIRNDRRQITIG